MSNKDFLSQEEIDALLRHSVERPAQQLESDPDSDELLSLLEKDALGEIGNISFGNAATVLSTLLGKKVDITTPEVTIIDRETLKNEFPVPHVAVHVNYVDGFNGTNLLVIRTRDAQVIADLMMGGDGHADFTDLNEIQISAVEEAMNQMIGSSATSMSTLFNRFINISPPGVNILDMAAGTGDDFIPPDDLFIKVSFRLKIGDLVDSIIMQLLPVSLGKEMVSLLLGTGGEGQTMPEATNERPDVGQPVKETVQAPPTEPDRAVGGHPTIDHVPPAREPVMPAMQTNQYDVSAAKQSINHDRNIPNRNVNVQTAQFASLPNDGFMHSDNTNLDLLLDIPLKVTVELGRTKKFIREILELSQNSIIELDKLAGEPVDILINNKLIAKGEVVVIDENFGVRVTDIISQWDRINKL